jgi:hypothetical protein
MSSGLPKPVMATFSGRFFASRSTSFQVARSGAEVKNADGCLIMTAAGTSCARLHLVEASVSSPKVSPVITEMV